MDITQTTSFLDHLRRLARQITDAADRQKPIDANACTQLARGFQELDEWLCKGGDAPRPWTED